MTSQWHLGRYCHGHNELNPKQPHSFSDTRLSNQSMGHCSCCLGGCLEMKCLTLDVLVLVQFSLNIPASAPQGVNIRMKNMNSSPPSATYMRQWIRSAWVQIMACRLFGAKPLSKPMLGYCQLDHWEQTSVTFFIKIENISFTKMHLKILSAKRRPFCPEGDELTCIDQLSLTLSCFSAMHAAHRTSALRSSRASTNATTACRKITPYHLSGTMR